MAAFFCDRGKSFSCVFVLAGGQQNAKDERRGGGRQGARLGRRPGQGHPSAAAGGHPGQRYVAHAHHRRPGLQHPDCVRYASKSDSKFVGNIILLLKLNLVWSGTFGIYFFLKVVLF